jgi:hypothetical protein
MMTVNSKVFSITVFFITSLIFITYLGLGIRSSYRSGNDMTPRWVGTKNLMTKGIDPYSDEGQVLIENAYFGHSLSESEKLSRDRQHYAYPLHVVFLYIPLIYMNISNAYLFMWLINFLSFIITCFLWIRLLELEYNYAIAIGLTAALLASPITWYTMQARQPLILVLGFLSCSLYIFLKTNSPKNLLIAGSLLFMATIKPQSSMLAIGYLTVILLPSLLNKKSIIYAYAGFALMAIFSLVVTNIILPGWIPEFLGSLKQYRNYAGSTGAETLLGKGIITYLASLFLFIIAIIMSVISYKFTNQKYHLITFAYVLVLQGFIFPAHMYVILLGIPLILIAIKQIIDFDSYKKGLPILTFILLIMVVYIIYRLWFTLFIEAVINNKVSEIAAAIGSFMPFGRIYLAIPLMLLLGILCFIGTYKYQHIDYTSADYDCESIH